MPVLEIPVWRHAPFIRLLPPLISGILTGYYFHPDLLVTWILFGCSAVLIPLYSTISTGKQFRYYYVTGVLTHALLICMGSLLVYYNNITHDHRWYGNHLSKNQALVATLQEPIVEKNKSYKAIALVNCLVDSTTATAVKGNIILYFEKSLKAEALKAGYSICFRKQSLPISGSGNPGAFDYGEYMALQNIYYQVYLKSTDYEVTGKKLPSTWKQFINKTRAQILINLRTYISSKEACGLAEALLIGYKDDLDKTLLQSYSNTGVVHVIAISGLHLGLIYWLLAAMLKPFARGRKRRLMRSLVIISGLWVFSVLAGASPSVLRSALMFSFIVIGEAAGRKSSIYNSLAASAFLLICYNPLWLWDAGFQLSYTAVLSLVIFMKPVYHLIFVKNKILDTIWNLTAVTLSAQVLTFPVCIYLFHQFPNYFLLTNLLAIPLSSIILLGEILLCVVYFSPLIASPLGSFLQWLILLMNRFIQQVEQLPFATLNNLHLTFTQLLLLYLVIICFSILIFHRNKSACFAGLAMLLLLAAIQTMQNYQATEMRKLIVYNIKGKGIECIEGTASLFITDSLVLKDKTIRQYTLQPSLVNQRIRNRQYITSGAFNLSFLMAGKKITVVSKSIYLDTTLHAQVLIISGNPVPASQFQQKPDVKLIVLDGSNSYNTAKIWKAWCQASGINYWNVAEKGAFILKLN